MDSKIASWLQQVLLHSKYLYRDRIYEDFEEVILQYEYIKLKYDKETKLLGLTGLIPITYYKDNETYYIQIKMWIEYNYPAKPPVFFVIPAENMNISPGNYVTSEGKIIHSYLNTYNSDPNSSLVEFISILREIFAIEMPLITRETY